MAEPMDLKLSFWQSEIKMLTIFFFIFLLLFICAYKAWFISPPCPHPFPYHPLHPLPLPPSIPKMLTILIYLELPFSFIPLNVFLKISVLEMLQK
jgi:hypothetical protein